MNLMPWEVDELIDVIRECRTILRNEDLLDGDIEQCVRDALNILGVADVEES